MLPIQLVENFMSWLHTVQDECVNEHDFQEAVISEYRLITLYFEKEEPEAAAERFVRGFLPELPNELPGEVSIILGYLEWLNSLFSLFKWKHFRGGFFPIPWETRLVGAYFDGDTVERAYDEMKFLGSHCDYRSIEAL